MPTTAQTPSERAAARLLALASHELRTPISIVSGYLRMLQRDDSLTEHQRKMINEADKACHRLTAIVTEMSDVARLDDGRTTMRAEGLDLFALVREVAGSADEASDRHVRLEIQGCEQSATLEGDRAFLHNALTVLVRAVLREQPDHTVVNVDGHLRGDGALIVIGSREQIDAVVNRAEAPFDDQRGGLGLALPIARRVIEAHGGRVWSPAHADGTATARSAILILLPLGPSASEA